VHEEWRIITRFLANGLWYLSSLPESLAFRLACRNVADTQQKLLLRLLRRNRDTEFGRHYDFASIRSVAEYQARVPLSTYEEYQDAISKIGEGQPCILTQDPVLLLEPTSGSTAATKHIPYTAALKAEFQRAIAPWMVNLFSHYPGLFLGQAYWSVTPVTRPDKRERTPGGIPIGFEEDSEYFGGWQRHLIQAVLAVPPLVRLIDNMETFRYVTLLFLLRSRSLALISIWNPTFLTLLVNRLPDWWAQLATDAAALAEFPDDARLHRWIPLAQKHVRFQGLPARICWLGYGERARAGLAFNELVRTGQVSAPIVIGRDHLDAGSVASPNRETEAMADGSDAVADWPLLNALVNTAAGASWVSIHHGGGVGIGYSQHAGMVVVADGTPLAAEKLERVLTTDPAMGVLRHVDAGYDRAIEVARERGIPVPMRTGD
jgi:hypothetical protein